MVFFLGGGRGGARHSVFVVHVVPANGTFILHCHVRPVLIHLFFFDRW